MKQAEESRTSVTFLGLRDLKKTPKTYDPPELSLA